MLPGLLLFLVPIGGGIPAGVLLAHGTGIGWLTAGALYFVSDVILAFTFEPLLRLLVALGKKNPFFVRFSEAMKQSMARSAARYGGPGTRANRQIPTSH